jgi:glycerophosphoryl diester phosphodiesterase
MAVPKRRTSQSKKNSRKATWKKKAEKQSWIVLARVHAVQKEKSTLKDLLPNEVKRKIQQKIEQKEEESITNAQEKKREE